MWPMRAPLCLLALLAALSVGCAGPSVDISKAVQLVDVQSGWEDAGIVDGQNKLLPAISFQVKNVSNQKLTVVQLNALFRRGTETDEWGSRFLPVVGSEGLAPGETTKRLILTSNHGYTGTEPRLDILKNSHFIDARVEVFAKYGPTQWKRLGEFPIARQLVNW
jgi:hypothetical protein